MDTELSDAMRFGILAEIHRAPAGTPRVTWHNEMLLDRSDELLQLALDQLAPVQHDFIVLLGDLTSSADAASFRAVLDAAVARSRPILALPGNHDSHDELALARFAESMRGHNVTAAPACVKAGDRSSIILTSIERDASTGAFHSADFPELAALQGKTLIALSHYPLLPMQARLNDASLKHSGDLTDRQDIADRLLQHDGPVVVVHGHLHVRAAEAQSNVLHISCAALVEPPHEVSFVSIANADSEEPAAHFQAKSIMTSNVSQLPVLDPANQEWRYSNGAWQRM